MQRLKRLALLIFVVLCLFKFVQGAGANGALRFDGSDDRVTLGPASATSSLGLTNLTIELWFMQQGPGVAAFTGTGGIAAVPLVTKGMNQGENSNQDTNYFFGIDGKTGALAADFEEFGSLGTPGLNHPLVGTTPLSDGVWYHGAVSYDSVSGQCRLYLNGNLEGSLNLAAGIRPRFDSIQFPALGAAFTTAGSYAPLTNGAFQGMIDEVRIWNFARSQTDIQATMSGPLAPPQAGLVGRWALDETSGTTVVDSAGTANGTLGNSTPAVAGGTPAFVDAASSFVSAPMPAATAPSSSRVCCPARARRPPATSSRSAKRRRRSARRSSRSRRGSSGPAPARRHPPAPAASPPCQSSPRGWRKPTTAASTRTTSSASPPRASSPRTSRTTSTAATTRRPARRRSRSTSPPGITSR